MSNFKHAKVTVQKRSIRFNVPQPPFDIDFKTPSSKMNNSDICRIFKPNFNYVVFNVSKTALYYY